MTTCELLSDRMPDVASGQAAWLPEEAAHLAGCAACTAEWRLVSATGSLASDLRMDSAAIARAVLERLRTEPDEATLVRRPWLRALAAAAVILLVFLPRSLLTVPQPGAPPAASIPLVDLPGLDALDESELEAVLEQVETPWSESSTIGAPTTGDLDDGELERVLRAWEG
jgi:hypothetical protein